VTLVVRAHRPQSDVIVRLCSAGARWQRNPGVGLARLGGGLLAAWDGAVQRACPVTDGGLNRGERYLPDLDYEDSCAAT